MSRVGNKAISLPPVVDAELDREGRLSVSGPLGKLSYILPQCVRAVIEGRTICLRRGDEARKTRALHGLARALINNMVTGVNEGFAKELEILGVGFRAQVQGGAVRLSLGFSHEIVYPIPAGIKIAVLENTKIRIEGSDRQVVGQVAADLRRYYPPEPYKGKGVRYSGERVVRKEGKTVQ